MVSGPDLSVYQWYATTPALELPGGGVPEQAASPYQSLAGQE